MNHEFKHAHDIQIEEWQLYWSPNYVSITMGIVAPSGVMATPSISLANGSGNATSSEPLEVVELLGVVVQGHALVHGGPLLVFNPIVELFCELQWNYQGVRTKKLLNL
jgi:hypothetical protein